MLSTFDADLLIIIATTQKGRCICSRRQSAIEAAILIGQRAADVTPLDHPKTPIYAPNLGLRYEHLGELSVEAAPIH
jgi:hypothetical protein